MFEHDDKYFSVYLNLFHKYIHSGQYSFGEDLYQSVSLMIFNCYIVKMLGILTWLDHGKQLGLSDQIDIFSNFSMYLEHSPKIYNQLYKILEEKGITSITGLALLMYS